MGGKRRCRGISWLGRLGCRRWSGWPWWAGREGPLFVCLFAFFFLNHGGGFTVFWTCGMLSYGRRSLGSFGYTGPSRGGGNTTSGGKKKKQKEATQNAQKQTSPDLFLYIPSSDFPKNPSLHENQGPPEACLFNQRKPAILPVPITKSHSCILLGFHSAYYNRPFSDRDSGKK